MIQKAPRHFEALGEFGGQRLHAESLSGVMATVKNVDAQFLGQSKRPMRPLAGDERVHSFTRRSFQFTARAAGYDAYSPADQRSTRKRDGFASSGAPESPRQLHPWDVGPGLETEKLLLFKKERAQIPQAQRRAKPRIVAQTWMRIQWQVR